MCVSVYVWRWTGGDWAGGGGGGGGCAVDQWLDLGLLLMMIPFRQPEVKGP